MKRVLIITYYWPPAGGGGVQRWLKMSKYLHLFGWQPIIYTPSNAEVSGMDDSLVHEIHPTTEVIMSPIWEPYDLYKKVLGIKKEEKIYSGFIQKDQKRPSWLKNMTAFIRGNFFIPDARKFWIKPGIRFLDEYIEKNKIDAIISTGPPHSTHMIALAVSRKHQIPWVADFRDPWTKIDFYKQLRLTWIADRIHKHLEKKVLKSATKVVSISPTLVRELAEISDRSDIQLITNGYDPADFNINVVKRTDKFVITHIGSMNGARNPACLWKAISELVIEDVHFGHDLEISLLGPVDGEIFKSMDLNGLSQFLSHTSFVPHDEAIKAMKSAHLLLLLINNTENQGGILPGKMFEYIGSQNPILSIGPAIGDAVELLSDIDPDSIASYDDIKTMKQRIYHVYKQRKSLTKNFNSRNEQFSRKELAGAYCQLLDQIT